jgi:hypothetical protein
LITIIEIALGIVLAVIILRFLPMILELGAVAAGIGIILVLAAGTIYLLYWGINSPEFEKILHSPEVEGVAEVTLFILLILFLYKSSLKGSWLEVGFFTSMLIFGLAAGVFGFMGGLENGKSPIFLITMFIVGVFIPAILLLLRGAVRFGLPNRLEHFAQNIPPRIIQWLGFRSENENIKLES